MSQHTRLSKNDIVMLVLFFCVVIGLIAVGIHSLSEERQHVAGQETIN